MCLGQKNVSCPDFIAQTKKTECSESVNFKFSEVLVSTWASQTARSSGTREDETLGIPLAGDEAWARRIQLGLGDVLGMAGF